jgi:protein gp37
VAVRLPVIQQPELVRPRTVADCANIPRPCAFVSCKFNLLIDLMEDGGLVLNAPSKRLAGAERVFPDRRAIDGQWYVEIHLPEHEYGRSLAAARARDEALDARVAERTGAARAVADAKATAVLDAARARASKLPAAKTPKRRERRHQRVTAIMERARARAAEIRAQAALRAEETEAKIREAAAQHERRRIFVLGPLDSAARAREVADLWAVDYGAGSAAVHRDWPADLERAGLVERDIDASFRDELEDAIEYWFSPDGEPVASCLLDEIKTLDRSRLDCLLDGIAKRMFVSRERVRQVLGSAVGKYLATSADTQIEEDCDMADKTAIAWCEHTHNLWIGCEHAPRDAPRSETCEMMTGGGPGSDSEAQCGAPSVGGNASFRYCAAHLEQVERAGGAVHRDSLSSAPTAPECDNCYAERFDRRYGGEHWGPDAPRRLLSDEYWRKPLRWNAAAEAKGERARVFCSSLADWAEMLGGERGRLLDEQRARLWELIPRTPWLDWLLLTKRIENAPKLLPWYRDGGDPWPNVWLGTTCGARSSLWRVRWLRQVRAVVRFVSGEPLLEHITAEEWDDVLRPWEGALDLSRPVDTTRVHQLIVGDESGSGRRPADPDWVRTARDAAARNGVAFLFKQWNGPTGEAVGITGTREGGKRTIHLPLLDGKRHDARPTR